MAIQAATNEKLSFQVPVPADKKLLGAETVALTVPLDGPSNVNDLTIAALIAFVSRTVDERFAGRTHFVLTIELRPDQPTQAVARVLLPNFG